MMPSRNHQVGKARLWGIRAQQGRPVAGANEKEKTKNLTPQGSDSGKTKCAAVTPWVKH